MQQYGTTEHADRSEHVEYSIRINTHKKVHLVGFVIQSIAVHGLYNIKFINAQQAKAAYKYKNIREKLYECNAALWYNKHVTTHFLKQLF